MEIFRLGTRTNWIINTHRATPRTTPQYGAKLENKDAVTTNTASMMPLAKLFKTNFLNSIFACAELLHTMRTVLYEMAIKCSKEQVKIRLHMYVN